MEDTKIELSYSLGEGGNIQWVEETAFTVGAEGLLSVVMPDQTVVPVAQADNQDAAAAAIAAIEARIKTVLRANGGGVEVIVIDDFLN